MQKPMPIVPVDSWCDIQDSNVGAHALRVAISDPNRLNIGIDSIAAAVPAHYAAEEQISRIFARLGRPAAADFVRGKLPTTKSIRSGDLGEILATEYVQEHTEYEVPIKRLRWKDHRNMAMRGDDVIGLAIDPVTNRLRFLKVESKSRATLAPGVVAEARSGLDKENGLPSAHALSFISSRLFEAGTFPLADLIDDAQLNSGIPAHAVKHLLFTFSGNSPENYLTASLQGYAGNIAQISVGIRVEGHAAFILAIYDRVIANAVNN